MKTSATALYPFVPSGPDFALALGFFAELGFEKQWRHDGLAGLRFGGVYFMLQRASVTLITRCRGPRARRRSSPVRGGRRS
jgi:hypothetical protein